MLFSITLVTCFNRVEKTNLANTLSNALHPYRMRVVNPPPSPYITLRRVAPPTARPADRVRPRCKAQSPPLCLSCTRIERRREVSTVWPACSLRLTIPQTESHESAWMAASLSTMYWPCAVRFSAARFPLFSLSSA